MPMKNLKWILDHSFVVDLAIKGLITVESYFLRINWNAP